MLVACAVLLIAFAFAITLWIRPSSLPEPDPVSPTQHLEDKKAAIYENLRDLQGEYRMGKLSDSDYQQTKLELQGELAGVLAEIDRIEGSREQPSASQPERSATAARSDR